MLADIVFLNILRLRCCPQVIVSGMPELRPSTDGKSMKAWEWAVRSNHLGQQRIFFILFSSEKRI